MARFVLFLFLLVPMVAAGNWLLAHPGIISVDWLGYEITMKPVFAVGMLALLCLFLVTFALMFWQFATWPERRRARRRYRTLSRGLSQLTHAVTALALGDEKSAKQSLKKAQNLLPGQPLPQLLTAQLLQRQGQHEAARKELRALMKHESTAMLASHRLIEQHMGRKEWAAALTLAEQVRAESPNDRWLILTLIDLHIRAGNLSEVLALTEGWQWKSPLSKEERHRYAAVAYVMIAQKRDEPRARLTSLRHAVGYAPDFLPAVMAYADLLIGSGEMRPARKLLRTAWLQQPDTLLIPLIDRTLGNEKPRAQARLLQAFLQGEPIAAHHLLAAHHAMTQHHPGEAEDALKKALVMEESKEACVLMAEAEKQMNGDDAANRWLTRAMDAPAGASWLCQRCGTAHAEWQAHCNGCEAFDTLVHEKPEGRVTTVELANRA